MTRKTKPYRLVLAILVSGGMLMSAQSPAIAGGSTYYADHISTCVDPCGGLSERGCACVKLPPIIITAE